MNWKNILKNDTIYGSALNRDEKRIKRSFHDRQGTGEADARKWAQSQANETGKKYRISGEDYYIKGDYYFFMAYELLPFDGSVGYDEIDISPQ